MQAPHQGAVTWWIELTSAFQDIFLLCVNLYIAFRLFILLSPVSKPSLLIPAPFLSPRTFWANVFLLAILIVLLLKAGNFYSFRRSSSALDDCRAVALATLLAVLLVSAINLISGTEMNSRGFTLSVGLLNLLTLGGWRLLKRKVSLPSISEPPSLRNVLIVGAGKTGKRLARFLENNKHLGYRVQGFLDRPERCDTRVLGGIEYLPQIARAHFVDEVIITRPHEREVVNEVVSTARQHRLDVKLILDLDDDSAYTQGAALSVEQIGQYPVLILHREPVPAFGLLVKRTLDIVLAVVSLVLLLPLLVAIAIAIRIDSPGPVFYTACRLGKKGRSFKFFKFRTMITGADGLKKELRKSNERQGPFFKLADDPRTTRLGKWLRKYSLDELPQLWNVVTGDMSLVGPRPHPIDDCQHYRLDHLRRLDVTPGITGLWQISSRRDPSFETSMSLDLEYIENWSLREDFRILLKTLPAVLRAQGQ